MNDTNQDQRPNVTPLVPNNSNTNSDSVKDLADYSVWPSLCNNKVNDNSNSIKILKRQSTPSTTSAPNDLSPMSSNDSNQNQSTSVCPQITLEDNTRTQYVPQVRILKRPNAKQNKDSNDKSVSNDRKITNANRSQSNNKTYEEREAEYARARLRILGSASAPEEESNNSSPLPSGTQTGNTYNSSPKSSQLKSLVEESNVPIIRLPIGPDGTKGFKRDLTSEQR